MGVGILSPKNYLRVPRQRWVVVGLFPPLFHPMPGQAVAAAVVVLRAISLRAFGQWLLLAVHIAVVAVSETVNVGVGVAVAQPCHRDR